MAEYDLIVKGGTVAAVGAFEARIAVRDPRRRPQAMNLTEPAVLNPTAIRPDAARGMTQSERPRPTLPVPIKHQPEDVFHDPD